MKILKVMTICNAICVLICISNISLSNIYVSNNPVLISEHDAANIAKSVIRKVLAFDDNSFVSCQREYDLERMFSKCLRESRLRIPYIFRISPEGEEVKKGVVIQHYFHPNLSDFIVAVSDSSTAYKISTTVDSEREFEKFIRNYGITLKDVESARLFVRFYLTVNPQNGVPKYLESVQEVREKIKLLMFNKKGKNGESLFEKWCLLYEDVISKLDYTPQIEMYRMERFIVTYYVLSEIDHEHSEMGPTILKVTLKLSKKGIISDIKFNPLWSHPKGDGPPEVII